MTKNNCNMWFRSVKSDFIWPNEKVGVNLMDVDMHFTDKRVVNSASSE